MDLDWRDAYHLCFILNLEYHFVFYIGVNHDWLIADHVLGLDLTCSRFFDDLTLTPSIYLGFLSMSWLCLHDDMAIATKDVLYCSTINWKSNRGLILGCDVIQAWLTRCTATHLAVVVAAPDVDVTVVGQCDWKHGSTWDLFDRSTNANWV